MSAWERVQLSRRKDRPTGSDYIKRLFTDFIELHGDRCYKDDKAIIGGIAKFQGIPVTVIAQEKGRTTKENIECNFGMPFPEGYRKALRLMKQAEKFGRPIICLVDTPGAFCGLEAEERGQGEAIARNLFEMSGLKVPVLSIVIGEGGSGGALAVAVADEVWMLENSVYSILSPEGFASILWKDSKKAKEAAEVMRLTAEDLKELADANLHAAQTKLMDILSNYQGFKKCTLILVFDAYKIEGHAEEVITYHNIHVVYTKEAETADQYIEKTVHKIGRENQVTVATSDGLEQIIIMGQGAHRMSARGLRDEIKATENQIRQQWHEKRQSSKNYLIDNISDEMAQYMKEKRLGKQ